MEPILLNVQLPFSYWQERDPETGAPLMRPDGRLLARPSGTEPVIRIMAEGSDSEQIAQIVLECAGALPDILNSIQ